MVVVADDTLYSGGLGKCSFTGLAIDSTYDYSISKQFYEPVTGRVQLISDSNLYVNLSRTVANLTFTLEYEGADALNAFVIINDDTVFFDAEGKVKVYNLPKEAAYPFEILSDNYLAISDTLFLVNDTSVAVALKTGLNSIRGRAVLHIYPVPASQIIHIESAVRIESVVLYNTLGSVVVHESPSDAQWEIDVSDLPAGPCLIRVRTAGRRLPHVRQLLIQH